MLGLEPVNTKEVQGYPVDVVFPSEIVTRRRDGAGEAALSMFSCRLNDVSELNRIRDSLDSRFGAGSSESPPGAPDTPMPPKEVPPASMTTPRRLP